MNWRSYSSRLAHHAWPWALATLAAAVLGALVNTQFTLAALQTLGAPVPLLERLYTTSFDLWSFMPFLSLLIGIALACAVPVAAWLARHTPLPWWLLHLAAGATGIAVALFVANKVSPMPTVVASTRDWPGYAALLAVGAFGGWLLGWLVRGRGPGFTQPGSGRPALQTVGLFGALLAMHVSARQMPDPPPATDLFTDYEIATLADGLAHPWGLAFLPDGRLLVTERAGRINLIDPRSQTTSVLPGGPDVRAGGQGGLMDIRLSPDFARDALVYMSHACGTPDANNTCISRARFAGTALVDLETIFRAQPLTDTDAQYGSRIQFLPDGTFIASIGDGFAFREQAQRLDNHLGKLVRLRADGSTPDDNPFVDEPGARPEIYSYGHRNPQGLVRDPETGVLYETEHGPRGGDEVNIIEPGANYGWPLAIHGVNYPGDRITPYTEVPTARSPIYHWRPSIAPSGLTIYRATMFPELQGGLLVSALSGESVYWLELRDRQVVDTQRLFVDLGQRIRLVEVGPDGSLYLLTDHDPGQVYRVSRTKKER